MTDPTIDHLSSATGVVERCQAALETIGRKLAAEVGERGRVSTARLNAIQPEAFSLARHLAQNAAARALVDWAGAKGSGAHERGLACTYAALAARDVASWLLFDAARLGLGDAPLFDEAQSTFVGEALSTPRLAALGAAVLERDREPAGRSGLEETHDMISREFARFADSKLSKVAEEIHRHDRLIPESLLQDMAGMGVFGISIPEKYGGTYFDHRTMIIATEELSRGSLGAGGSVITRPEICAKAILEGGTDEQKNHWLPRLASGEVIISVAVTEPDAGSDVAAVKVTARKVDGGYVINGEKTWCTFAGRANTLCLLARTGRPEEGHRGLSLFLVEKPSRTSDEEGEHAFEYSQEGGGTMSGHAIATIGYRGMHSFSIGFEDWFVPEDHRIGDEGRGFYLQMAGFAGGRIQTAARAVGVMEAAFREALAYCRDRTIFGQTLAEFTLSRTKVCEMAARIQAGRQLAYAIGDQMDDGGGHWEASLVKLMTCKDAEWITREAMQLHGGMGYSEEYPVSRYWLDARVLSIFEGAEEVLALLVIARQYFGRFLAS